MTVKYLLSLYYREEDNPAEGSPEFDAEMKVWHALTDELRQAGVLVAVSGLLPETATTLRGETVTDGPYAETKEILFSFYIIDVEDLDAALAWARKMPATTYGSVQIHATHGYEAA